MEKEQLEEMEQRVLIDLLSEEEEIRIQKRGKLLQDALQKLQKCDQTGSVTFPPEVFLPAVINSDNLRSRIETIKILMLHEGGVGSTALLYKYVNGTFVADTSMTTGVQFHFKSVDIGGIRYCLAIWDFAGQERWRFMLPSFSLGAQGAMLLYDTTRQSTMDQLEEWVQVGRTHDTDLPILFCGTKIDLVEERSVTQDYAHSFLQALNLFDYIEVSAKTGENVDEVFDILLKKILE